MSDTIARSGARRLWKQAVDAGAAGHGARAFAFCDQAAEAARRSDDEATESLVLSTRASLYRQAGHHDHALILDGAGLWAVGMYDADVGTSNKWRRAAQLDALVGLAADNLGRSGYGAAERLLDRANTLIDRADSDGADADWDGGGRGRLRWVWVSSELGLYRGDHESARRHVETAGSLLDRYTPQVTARHRIKTRLIAAAVDAAEGHHAEAFAAAEQCLDDARARGLLPLQWASLSMLAGLPAGRPPGSTADTAYGTELAGVQAELVHRGMRFGLAGAGG